MSLPTAEQNGVFTHVYPASDLAVAVTYAPSATSTGTPLFSTGMPATLICIVKLVSGAGRLDVQVGSEDFTPTFSGGDNTAVTLSGTSYAIGVVNTSFTFDDSDSKTTTISVDKRYVAVKVTNTSGANTMGIAEFAIMVCYELTPGEDWFQGLRASANAVANRTVGDGAGTVSLVPDYADNPYLNPDLKL